MKLWLTLKHRFYTKEKFLKLFCIQNGFAKNSAKCHNLFKYFFSHIIVIPRKDAFLYYRKNQIPFTKYFSGTRVNLVINKCLNGQLSS